MSRTADSLDISPAAAAELIATENALLLDCRTVQERNIAAIEDSLLIPLHELHRRVRELGETRDRPIVVYCHAGVRSRTAAKFLREQGFMEAYSMEGGIDRWAVEIDPDVPRY